MFGDDAPKKQFFTFHLTGNYLLISCGDRLLRAFFFYFGKGQESIEKFCWCRVVQLINFSNIVRTAEAEQRTEKRVDK